MLSGYLMKGKFEDLKVKKISKVHVKSTSEHATLFCFKLNEASTKNIKFH
jgi:hypothetical protein